MEKNIIIFIDKFGRTLMGEVIDENVCSIQVKNPGVIHISQNAQNKGFNFQLLPLILFEIVDVSSTKSYITKFNKEDISILTTDGEHRVKANETFIKQYNTIFDALANGLQTAEKSQEVQQQPNILEVK